jgi:hypothetical protein
MMSIQARESFVPYRGAAHPLREYPLNSPRAKARLVVLALLADGRLDKREFASLEKRGVYAALGLSREDFVAVLLDFCSDAAHLPNSQGSYLISPQILQGLFAEVAGRAERRALVQHIFATLCSDGQLDDGEERLFWNAVDAWNLRTTDLSPDKNRVAAIQPPPQG